MDADIVSRVCVIYNTLYKPSVIPEAGLLPTWLWQPVKRFFWGFEQLPVHVSQHGIGRLKGQIN